MVKDSLNGGNDHYIKGEVGIISRKDPAVIRPPLCTYLEEHVNSAICFLVKHCTVLTSFL